MEAQPLPRISTPTRNWGNAVKDATALTVGVISRSKFIAVRSDAWLSVVQHINAILGANFKLPAVTPHFWIPKYELILVYAMSRCEPDTIVARRSGRLLYTRTGNVFGRLSSMRVPFAYGASAVDATYVALGYEVMAGKEYVHNEVLE
ncbi:hypothetical protein H0G86_011681 [Trichoderma simmonsii]|uniref:Uncharacterized protein n=1 Tax=Trichoderma simmonsii TaxID=1491479 RepID=A0A8G0PQ67_9HYPO|nr:hypothetical protein H0G86_011681 [Trichoderma simmonsii]